MQDPAGTSLTTPATPPASPQELSAGARRPRRVLVGIALLTLLADQGSKFWALHTLTRAEPRPLVGDWIQLNLIANSGAAFSIGAGMTWVLTLLALVITFVAIRAALRVNTLPWAVALGLLIGGSLGNLTDRLLRQPGFARGHVVDFIDYFGLFIGNVADIAIVVAAALMAVPFLRGIPLTTGTDDSG